MKVINIMNFVRYIDERRDNSIEFQYETTRQALELVKAYGFKNTFLLQYDAVCDENGVIEIVGAGERFALYPTRKK